MTQALERPDARPTKAELVERYKGKWKADVEEPSLQEVLNAFGGDELYLVRRDWTWMLKWNRHDNRYTDPTVWADPERHTSWTLPTYVKHLFERVGVEVR